MIFIIFFSLVFITTFALWKYVRLKHDVYEYTEKLDNTINYITVSSYTAALSQCHFRSIIQSIPHTLQHQEISTFRSVTHAFVVSQQTHAVMFRLLLFYTESCKNPRGFLQLFPISRCLFTPHFI